MQGFKKFFRKGNRKNLGKKYDENDITKIFVELSDLTRKKISLQDYIEKLNNKEAEIAVYEGMGEETTKKIRNLIIQHKHIIEQKQMLKSKLLKNNKGLLRFNQYEKELPGMMKEMEEADRLFKESERDLVFLEEERDSLLEERDWLLKGYGYLRGFVFAMIMMMSVLVLLAFGLIQIFGEVIWLYLSGLSVVLVVLIVGILYAKGKLEKNLRDNEILQKKAVKYMNKVKIRYFNHKRYLDFQFEKLDVDSYATLEMMYNRYLKSKESEEHYGQFSRQMMIIEEELLLLFDEHNATFSDMAYLEEWIDSPRKNGMLKQLIEERQKNIKQLEGLVAFEEELWAEIETLKMDERYKMAIEEEMAIYKMSFREHLDKK